MTEGQIPRSMDDLREVIGEDALVSLLLAFPGMELKVPKTLEADHPIARAIGEAAASKLARHLGGGRIYISASLARATRNSSITDAHDAGDTVEEIALRHGLSGRHVTRILAKG